MATPQQTEICVPCSQQFDDWQAYIRHMITSGNHPHSCATCGQEFQSEEGKMNHQRQAHPTDGQLTCTGCHKEFTRGGSLLQHIETDGCPVLQKAGFRRMQDATDDYYKTSLAPVSQIQYKVPKASPAPVARVVAPSDFRGDFETQADYATFQKKIPPLLIQKHGHGSTNKDSTTNKPVDMDSPTKAKAEVDLIEMSPNAKVPKPPWPGLARLKPFSIAAKDTGNKCMRNENVLWEKEPLEISPRPERPLKFPDSVSNHSSISSQLPNIQSRMCRPDLGALSRTSNILQSFQELKLGEPQPTAQAIELAIEEPAPKYHHNFDPDGPGFNLEQYRNPYSKKYRCAFAGCSKLLNSSQALYMHLKSNAHLTDRYQCPSCLNEFHSASAITQHLESQTNRCKARDDRRLNQIVDQVSGGLIDTAGTHNDNTHRYYSAQIAPKLQLDTAHEAKEEVIINAVHDPEYRSSRVREREKKLQEERARSEAWQNDDWGE